MSGWEIYQHKPTRVEAIQFTAANREKVRELLTADLGTKHFSMTDTHLVIHTSQGDSREAHLGCWVIRRRRNRVARFERRYEVYVFEDEVMDDYVRVVPRRGLLRRRPS